MKRILSSGFGILPFILPAGIISVLGVAIFFFYAGGSLPESFLINGNEPQPVPQIWKTASGKKPQFIVFSFDGSKSVDMWRKTREFASELRAEGKPISYTYFLNAVYFLGDKYRDHYQGPEHEKGKSAIGFGGSAAEIEDRIGQANLAYSEGHEIGSHTAGHFSGSDWTREEWGQEFASFFDLIGNINAYNPDIPATVKPAFSLDSISGFRAPNLAVSPGLADTLAADHFRYDASRTAYPGAWPYKLPNGLWEFPLGSMRVGGTWMLSMDYNFFFNQTGGRDILVKDSPEWKHDYDDLMTGYREYFNENYASTRAPIYIANHFEEWNGGLYWEAIKGIAREECGKPEVHCVNYKGLADALDAAPPGVILK